MAILIRKIQALNFKKTFATVILAGLTAFLLLPPPSLGSHNIEDGVCKPDPPNGAPLFNYWPVSYTPETCHDLPMIDARILPNGNFAGASRVVSANPGDRIGVQLYLHNGATDENINAAINTVMRAFASPSLGNAATTHTLSASIRANNHAEIFSSSRGGDITAQIQGGVPQSLSLVPGTTVYFKNWGSKVNPPDISQIINLPDTIFTSGVNLGDVRGCWQYSGFVNFQLQVSSVQAGNLQIKKEVKNVTDNTVFNDVEVDADPSEQVQYRITVSAQTNPVNNVFVRDSLDPKLFFTGVVTLDGVVVPPTDLFSSAGLSLGNLNTGITRIILFKANVAPRDQFTGTGTFILPNIATAFSESQTISDAADVRVVILPQQIVCTFAWNTPTLSDGRGQRRVGEPANVQQQVTGLQPNQSFNIVNQHVSGDPVFRSAAQANSQGNYSNFDTTIIPPSYVAGDYNVFIEVGSAHVATCRGFRIEPPSVAQIDIQKTVRNVTTGEANFVEQTDAAPSQRVMFQLVVSPQSSNTTLTNVIVRDVLPGNNKLSYVPNSFFLDGSFQNPENFFTTGLNIGNVSPGQSRVITFMADIAGPSFFNIGCEILVNTAFVTADGNLSDSDTANVRVCKGAPTKASGSPAPRP